MRQRITACGLCIGALWLAGAGAAVAQAPQGWMVAGSAPQDYSFSREERLAATGKASARITAKDSARTTGFGTLMQTISAEDYRSGRWRLSGYMKTENANRAQMWMRIDGPDRTILGFDNMDSRPVAGTTDWQRYEIVLDVPKEALAIAFGFFLSGPGTAWGDDFKLEKVDADVPLTTMGGAAMPRGPQNTNFE